MSIVNEEKLKLSSVQVMQLALVIIILYFWFRNVKIVRNYIFIHSVILKMMTLRKCGKWHLWEHRFQTFLGDPLGGYMPAMISVYTIPLFLTAQDCYIQKNQG